LADKFVERFLICDKREQGYSGWIARLSRVNDGRLDRLKVPGDKVEPVKAIPADEGSNTLLILEYYIQPLVPSVGEGVSNSASLRNTLQDTKVTQSLLETNSHRLRKAHCAYMVTFLKTTCEPNKLSKAESFWRS
jgi:hypothetical protein